MRTFLRLLLFCLVSATAHAATWSPYIGLGGQANIIGSYTHDWMGSAPGYGWQGYPGYGEQMEVGFSSARFDVYLAYRVNRAESTRMENRSYYEWQDPITLEIVHVVSYDFRRTWTDHRLLIGGRWRLSAPEMKVRPLVGAALSFGQPVRTSVTRTMSSNDNSWSQVVLAPEKTQTSDLAEYLPGGQLEFGFAVKAARRIDMLVLSSVAVAPVRFAYQTREMENRYEWHTLLSPALSLNARYTFFIPPIWTLVMDLTFRDDFLQQWPRYFVVAASRGLIK